MRLASVAVRLAVTHYPSAPKPDHPIKRDHQITLFPMFHPWSGFGFSGFSERRISDRKTL